MNCECGTRLECYDGYIYCHYYLSFGIVPDAAPDDDPAEPDDADLAEATAADDLDGDAVTALRDAGWGCDEDYGCFDGGD